MDSFTLINHVNTSPRNINIVHQWRKTQIPLSFTDAYCTPSTVLGSVIIKNCAGVAVGNVHPATKEPGVTWGEHVSLSMENSRRIWKISLSRCDPKNKMIEPKCIYWGKICHCISYMDLWVNCSWIDIKIAGALQWAAHGDQYQCFLSSLKKCY